MKRPTADVLFLYKKLSKLRHAAKLLVTQLLSPLEHHSFSIRDVIALLYTNHNITIHSCVCSLLAGSVEMKLVKKCPKFQQ